MRTLVRRLAAIAAGVFLITGLSIVPAEAASPMGTGKHSYTECDRLSWQNQHNWVCARVRVAVQPDGVGITAYRADLYFRTSSLCALAGGAECHPDDLDWNAGRCGGDDGWNEPGISIDEVLVEGFWLNGNITRPWKLAGGTIGDPDCIRTFIFDPNLQSPANDYSRFEFSYNTHESQWPDTDGRIGFQFNTHGVNDWWCIDQDSHAHYCYRDGSLIFANENQF